MNKTTIKLEKTCITERNEFNKFDIAEWAKQIQSWDDSIWLSAFEKQFLRTRHLFSYFGVAEVDNL